LVIADAIEVTKGFDAGSIVTASGVFAEIVNDGTRGALRLYVIIEAEAGQFSDTKLFAEDAFGVIALEDPIFEAGFDAASAIKERNFGGFKELLRAREKGFPGAVELEFIAQGFFGMRADEFGGQEFAGGEIHEGQADDGERGIVGGGGEEIVFAGVEDGDVGGGAGSDDAGDFAANKLFAGAGLLHLFADGDFEAGADEASEIGIGGVVRNATHGNGLAFFAIAGGEGDLKFAGGDDGVFVEEFVEIAETEEKEGVGVAGFDRVVLLHEWGGGFGHGESSKLSVVSFQ